MDVKHKIKKCFNKAANTYDNAAFIQLAAGKILLEKLYKLDLPISIIADIGAGTGYLTRKLADSYSNSSVFYVDFAEEMLANAKKQSSQKNIFYVNSDFDFLPFANDSIELIFSNFSLQWSIDISKTFLEFYRILKPGGHVLFSTLGPLTLNELYSCWRLVDSNCHINNFNSFKYIKKHLRHIKMKSIIIRSTIITVYFSSVFDIMHNLKLVGANCVINKNFSGFIGKGKLRRLEYYYEAYRNNKNQLPVSYEVIYVTAIK